MESDKINLQVLSEVVEEVDEALSIIFEKSQQSSEVPNGCKRGNITLILKKGKRETWRTPDKSVSPLCPARSWHRSLWKLC